MKHIDQFEKWAFENYPLILPSHRTALQNGRVIAAFGAWQYQQAIIDALRQEIIDIGLDQKEALTRYEQ